MARYGQYSEEEFNALCIDRETGLYNDNAWQAVRAQRAEDWVLAIQRGFLTDHNFAEAFGGDARREVLRLLANVLRKQARGYRELWVARLWPNEVAASYEDRTVLEDLGAGVADVFQKVGVFRVRPDGTAVILRGVGFAFATGEGYEEAQDCFSDVDGPVTLEQHSAGALSERLAALREEGFLLLDGRALVAERTNGAAEDAAPVPVTEAHEDSWPVGASDALGIAMGAGSYFATACEILSSAARMAILRRRSERVNQPVGGDDWMRLANRRLGPVPPNTDRLITPATVYDTFEGSRDIGELSRGEQNELIGAVFSSDGDFRKLAMRKDVKKAQPEGLWTLVVLLGLGLEDARGIESFDKRTTDDVKKIVQLLIGTQLGARLLEAFSERGIPGVVDYDWSELENDSINEIMSENAGDPLPTVLKRVREVLEPSAAQVRASSSNGRDNAQAFPRIPDSSARLNASPSSGRPSAPENGSTGNGRPGLFRKLRGMFTGKPSAEEAKLKRELTEFIDSLKQEDWGIVTLLAGYWWKFGKEKSDLAFTRAIQTLQYANGRDPELRASAARSIEMTRQWAEKWGAEAAEWGRECVRLAVAGKAALAPDVVPDQPTAGVSPQQAFAARIAKYRLTKEDMQPLHTISAFAWKYANMPPARAVEFAMQTIYLSRHGSEQEKKDADTSWQSAVVWSIDAGLDGVSWGFDCVERVRTGKY